MSNANPASNAMRGAARPETLEALRRLAALAVGTVTSVVTACAMRRAYSELASLDDRLLADVGLDRATVETLAGTNLREAWKSLARLPWNCTHTSA